MEEDLRIIVISLSRVWELASTFTPKGVSYNSEVWKDKPISTQILNLVKGDASIQPSILKWFYYLES